MFIVFLLHWFVCRDFSFDRWIKADCRSLCVFKGVLFEFVHLDTLVKKLHDHDVAHHDLHDLKHFKWYWSESRRSMWLMCDGLYKQLWRLPGCYVFEKKNCRYVNYSNHLSSKGCTKGGSPIRWRIIHVSCTSWVPFAIGKSFHHDGASAWRTLTSWQK